METFIAIFLRGLAVGLLVSAPMGPVGILCIQRSLSKGRLTGLYTGIGAAISDLIYCLLTGFGLVFIEEFLERNQTVIQLVGSIVLIGFAIWLFRKNPTAGIRSPEVEAGSPGRDILGGFLFTFSNPLILFLIIGLFARFNFLAPQHKFYHYIVGYIGIVGGALGWWYLVTYFVDKLRAHFNVRSMWIINRVIGVVILIFAIVGIIGALTSTASGASPPSREAIQLIGTEERVVAGEELTFSGVEPAQIRWITGMEGKGYPRAGNGYRLTVGSGIDEENAGSVQLTISFGGATDTDPLYNGQGNDRRTTRVRVELPDHTVYENEVGSQFGGMPLRWELQRHRQEWILYAGQESREELVRFPYTGLCGPVRFDGDGGVWISDMIVRGNSLCPAVITSCETTPESKAMPAPLEGIWKLYDWSYDDGKAEIAGDYLLRLEATADGYDIYYIDGARLYPGQWPGGRLKGQLIEDMAGEAYDLLWVDAEGETLRGNRAEEDSYGQLVLKFPFRNSELRFRRVEL